MSLIFISHSSQDGDAARDLRDRLQAHGFSAEGSLFLDFDGHHGIKAGQDWEQTLYRNVRACRAVIVLCSRASMASRWCFMEITHARALGKNLFPVKIDDCDVDGILADHQMIDLTIDKEDGYQRILRGIAEAGLDPRDLFFWDGRRPPYPGLLAYQEADAGVFFGRDEEIAEGVDLLNRCRRLGDTRLVMLLGASGSGKSSVVRAGLVPRLRRDIERWLVVDPLRPQNDPIQALADVLSRAFERAGTPRSAEGLATEMRAPAAAMSDSAPPLAASTGEATAQERTLAGRLFDLERAVPDNPPMQSVRRHLRLAREDLERAVVVKPPGDEVMGAANPLSEAIAALRRANRRDAATVLFVIDQFEELLERPPGHPAHDFLRLLRSCLDRAGEPVMVLGTLRADFLGSLQASPALAGLRVEPLSLRSVQHLDPVISQPALTAGIELEPGLVETLVTDAQRPEALPLLAFALRELYDRVGERTKVISLRDYHDIGGLDGAVAQAADQLVAHVDSGTLALLRQSLLRLARITDDGHFARRTVRWDDLDAGVHPILQRFVDARLLVTDERGGQRVVEVAHEALFRSWDTLRQWLNESIEELRLRRDLEASAQAWDTAGRSPEYLWRGARLARAVELGTSSPGQSLEAIERAFLDAAQQVERAEHDREELRRRRQLRWTRIAVSVVSALLVAAIYLYYRATLERNLSQAQKLASDSELLRQSSVDTTLPALLAIESLRRAETAQGYEALWRAASTLASERVRLPDSAPAKPRYEFGSAVMFAPDGATLAVGTDDPLVRVFDAVSARELARLPLAGEVRTLAFSPGGVLVAASADVPKTAERSSYSAVSIMELASRRQLAQVSVDEGTSLLRFSPDGTMLAIGAGKLAGVYRARDGVEVARFKIGHFVKSVAFSADSTLLAVGSDDEAARVFDVQTGKQRSVVQPDPWTGFGEVSVRAVAFSPDGFLLALGVTRDAARVSRVETGEVIGRLSHAGAVTALAFSPDGKLLATASADGMARVFTFRQWREMIRVPIGDSVQSVVFSPDGSHVAAVSGTSVRVFDARTGIERARAVNPKYIGSVSFSPDSVSLAIGTGNLARVIEVRASNEFKPNTDVGLPTYSNSLAIAPASLDQQPVTLLEPGTQKVVKRPNVDVGSVVSSACFAGGGSLIVTSSSVKSSWWLTAFDTRSGQVVWKIPSQERWQRVECGADGHLITAIAGNEVLVTDARSGRTALRLDLRSTVNVIAFSGDRSLLATGTADGYARVHVISTALEIARMPLGEGVLQLAFEGDRVLRVTTGAFNLGEEGWFYRASREQFRPADRITAACARLKRNLTREEWSQYVGGSYRDTCSTLGVPVARNAAPAPAR